MTPRPTPRQRERDARIALGVAITGFAAAIGAAEFTDGMRSIKDNAERRKRSTAFWEKVDRRSEAIERAVQTYARAIRASAKENAK